jgi:hypothetical protein
LAWPSLAVWTDGVGREAERKGMRNLVEVFFDDSSELVRVGNLSVVGRQLLPHLPQDAAQPSHAGARQP